MFLLLSIQIPFSRSVHFQFIHETSSCFSWRFWLCYYFLITSHWNKLIHFLLFTVNINLKAWISRRWWMGDQIFIASIWIISELESVFGRSVHCLLYKHFSSPEPESTIPDQTLGAWSEDLSARSHVEHCVVMVCVLPYTMYSCFYNQSNSYIIIMSRPESTMNNEQQKKIIIIKMCQKNVSWNAKS